MISAAAARLGSNLQSLLDVLSSGCSLLDACIIDLPCEALLREPAGPSLQQAPPKTEGILHRCTPMTGSLPQEPAVWFLHALTYDG